MHAIALLEVLNTIKLILVGWNLASIEQLEEEGEEIHLSPLWLHWVVECCILVLSEVDGTVDVTSPTGVFRHIDSGGEHETCTVCPYGCGVSGSSGAVVLHSALLRLGETVDSCQLTIDNDE